MMLPHESTFAFRRHAFVVVTAAALGLALRLASLNPMQWLIALLTTSAVATLLYWYARWLARSDGRFLVVHPRKIRGGLLFLFYAPLFLVCVLLVAAPWVLTLPGIDQFQRAAVFLAIPCALAMSAGALRGARECAAV